MEIAVICDILSSFREDRFGGSRQSKYKALEKGER
jgi:hypothetical protein